MEWSGRNKFNSFNSYKGLTYYENYKLIMAWMNGAKYLPPPIECNLDPFASCNLDCYFCVGQRYIKHHREEVAMKELPTDYMIRLVDFLSSWGVRGLCISGGGEPSLHKGIWKVIDHAFRKIDICFVTNATNLRPELLTCKWVALSVDAASRNTYRAVKGKDKFDLVIKNISKLADIKNNGNYRVNLCFKFLVLPENELEIYEACKLAKELGVQDFHARPVDFERKDIEGHKKLSLHMDLIQRQFEMCHKLEDSRFRVFTVTHKFDEQFHVKHDFERCLATPLVIPILTDGNAYLCVDHKMEAKYKLGSCYPNPENILERWGSVAHRELIKSININECSRCTWSQYNKQITETIIEDKMDISFP